LCWMCLKHNTDKLKSTVGTRFIFKLLFSKSWGPENVSSVWTNRNDLHSLKKCLRNFPLAVFPEILTESVIYVKHPGLLLDRSPK
jgi:hypothetical protein